MVSTLEGIKLEQEGKQVKNTFVIFDTINIIIKLSLGENTKSSYKVSVFIASTRSAGQFLSGGNLPKE